jgi:phosphoribosylaminoimidazolecarboxamide formyltransferase/IMP cyclohydrolase
MNHPFLNGERKGASALRKWALVSVYDKRGVAEFAARLVEAGYSILSTGGTARHLQESGIEVTLVEDYTGFPEMMDGRVKTLHPRIHGGLLSVRDLDDHVEQMLKHGIEPIDVVVVNLYPFQQTISKPGVTFAEAVEMIDIGGPSMLRSAAKNHRFCLPVVDPDDYPWIADALTSGTGVSPADRVRLAAKLFRVTAEYDAAISAYLAEASASQGEANPAVGGTSNESTGGASVASVGEAGAWSPVYAPVFIEAQSLRYGENPHQRAHFYRDPNASLATIAGAKQLQGKELSYNNIQDADAALNIVRAFDDLGQPVAVAVKHMNPCGVGMGDTIHEAFARAYEADPVSIFGGIVAVNRPIDGALAQKMTELFLEVIIAPGFSDDALATFSRKKNLRLLTVNMTEPLWKPGDKVFKRVSGGLLVQDVDVNLTADWNVVTKRQPTEEEKKSLEFAWRVVKFVKSNAIVLAQPGMTVGVGAGQMNRVGAARIAIEQAGARAKGSVLASDAFFPMRDTVDTAAAAGVTAIIQPGGSIKDADSIAAADEHGIAMIFTGKRHFVH